MHGLLEDRLAPILRRQRRLQLACRLAGCWAAPALLGLVVLGARQPGEAVSSWWVVLLGLLGLVGTIVVIARRRRDAPDWRGVACRIEARHPELNGLLLTAVQQEAGSAGRLSYLQDRIVREALEHDRRHEWTRVIPRRPVFLAAASQVIALALFLMVLWALRPHRHGGTLFAGGWTGDGVTVSPGDTSLERGQSLVVMARFDGRLPANVDLVVGPTSQSGHRIPLVKNLADPMFGGSVPEVSTNFVYRLEYAGRRTREFQVNVFEYPRLERADAALTFPDYTALAPKQITNTTRISAVEGSRLDLTLQLNKPVASARFVSSRDPTNVLALVPEPGRPVARLTALPLRTNDVYQLQLVDAEGRTNRVPAPFVLDVLKNREPELKLAAPRGDLRPSPLEEIAFEGTVWDDFGVPAYGLGYALAGQDVKFIELGGAVPGGEKRAFRHLLRLEELGVQPDQLVSWFVWADDIGPDGKMRRSTGDLFFAEVRPFDEIFREGQGQSENEQAGAQSGQGGNRADQLVELQKQIITATWKLQRDQGFRPAGRGLEPPGRGSEPSRPTSSVPTRNGTGGWSGGGQTFFGQRAADSAVAAPATPRARTETGARTNRTSSVSNYREDLGVVREALAQALEQAQSLRERESDPRSAGLWDEVLKGMRDADAQLDKALRSPSSLTEALAAERAAFQALLKLQEHEYNVARNRNRGQSGNSSREQQMQQQLRELELTQAEDRYETERAAQAPETPERREQLQVLNRLRELARRQQDLNDRLQELQTALQEARTDSEREEIRRRLKRLQEEEQRMLADVDELQQRMNQPGNQSRMTEQRQQLERTREEIQRAAAAAEQGSASQALASGTRAQRQLQEMRDELRRQNAAPFSEDLRRLRSDARELARQQDAVQKKLDELGDEGRKTLSDSAERQQSLDQLARQKSSLTNVLDRAAQLAEQTEEAEPLVYRELYDTLRKFNQDDARPLQEAQQDLIQRGLMNRTLYDRLKATAEQDPAKSLELTSEMVRQDLLPQARQAGQSARSSITELKRGVERAAEKVLGDDTEALRRAQQQLDQLTDQLAREMARAQSGEGSGTNTAAGANATATTNAVAGTNAAAGTNATAGATAQRAQSGQRGGARGSEPPAQAAQGGQQSPSETEPQSNEQAQASGTNAANQSGRGRGGQQPNSPGREANAEGAPAGAQDQNASPQTASNPPNQDSQQTGQTPGNARAAQPGPNPQERPDLARGRGRGGRSPREGNPGANAGDGGSGLPVGWDEILRGEDREVVPTGPVLTGEDFGRWSDRLREVEEMVDDTALQNELATSRERARRMRQEYVRDRTKPDWAVVQLQVIRPLVEVRDQIAEELARREPRNPLVPIDRDPVPNRFSELVRRYYEELGKDR